VQLVTRGHFRSRDQDGSHTIPSAIAENPMLRTRKHHGSMFYITGVIADQNFTLRK